MLGFTLPLFIILAIESTVGALLLCPKPVCNPAIALARLSYTQVGTTVFHTLAGVLLLLLASPIYDGARIYYASKEATEQTSLELRWGVGERGLRAPAASRVQGPPVGRWPGLAAGGG